MHPQGESSKILGLNLGCKLIIVSAPQGENWNILGAQLNGVMCTCTPRSKTRFYWAGRVQGG